MIRAKCSTLKNHSPVGTGEGGRRPDEGCQEKIFNREPRHTGEREFKCAEGMAEDLQFEKAALLRNQIQELKHMLDGTKSEAKPVSYRKSKRARK
jgi:hypothetical protein